MEQKNKNQMNGLFIDQHIIPPKVKINKGKGLDIIWGKANSPFGNAILFTSKYGLVGLAFFDEGKEKQTYDDMANRWKNAYFSQNDEEIKPLANKIFNPKKWNEKQPIKIALIGSDFEVRVWQKLMNIALGKTKTYGELAKLIDKPKAARAVGGAIGRNPISFIVPCHRVVGANGKLTGYHWGLERKQAMLGWEVGVKTISD